jgi:hydroxyacylglutathione hydrolase
MFFKRFSSGMYEANCYLLGDNDKGVLIDAGVNIDELMEYVDKNGLTIEYIVLTHAHIDHMTEVDIIRERTGARAAVHEADLQGFTSPCHNGSDNHGGSRIFSKPDILLKGLDIIEAGGIRLEVIYTPGHTAGGICLRSGNRIFTGDTLFRQGIGRTDVPYAIRDQLIHSIKTRLLVLEDEMEVFTGHGEPTTIGFERKNNPFL